MKVKSIQCKQCAAPLSLYGGGHRIRSLTCEYCGALMNVQDDFTLLGQFKHQSQPDCPFSIGMQGDIKGISFIIIGMVSYRSNYGDNWTDMHLYSATHGYAWLSYDLGHFTFTRRVRNLPNQDMKELSRRQIVRVNDKPYAFMEAYQTEVIHVVGELTWIAKVGDSSILWDAIAPPFMFTLEEINNEHEYHLTEYIDPKDIEATFTLNFDTHQSFVHPAQPFKAPIRQALSKASIVPFALSLLLLFFLNFLNMGSTVLTEKVDESQIIDQLYVRDFTVSQTKHLLEIKFNNNYARQFQIKDITLFDDTHEVFSFGKQLSRKSSSVSSQQGTAQFKISKTGLYTLRMRTTKTSTSTSTAKVKPFVSLQIKQGMLNNRYLKYLLYLSIVSFLLFYIGRYLFNKKRWDN